MLQKILVHNRFESLARDTLVSIQQCSDNISHDDVVEAIEYSVASCLGDINDPLAEYLFPFETTHAFDLTDKYCNCMQNFLQTRGNLAPHCSHFALSQVLGMKNYNQLLYLQHVRSAMANTKWSIDTIGIFKPSWLTKNIKPNTFYYTPIKGHGIYVKEVENNKYQGLHSDGLWCCEPFSLGTFRAYFLAASPYLAAINALASNLSNCGPECWRLLASQSPNRRMLRIKSEEACDSWQERTSFTEMRPRLRW